MHSRLLEMIARKLWFSAPLLWERAIFVRAQEKCAARGKAQLCADKRVAGLRCMDRRSRCTPAHGRADRHLITLSIHEQTLLARGEPYHVYLQESRSGGTPTAEVARDSDSDLPRLSSDSRGSRLWEHQDVRGKMCEGIITWITYPNHNQNVHARKEASLLYMPKKKTDKLRGLGASDSESCL